MEQGDTCLATAAYAEGTHEWTGVNKKGGNPSPTAGFSAGEANSRLDDYVNQDEQINIDGDKDNVVKVLRVNQKNLINDYVSPVFPIKRASAMELRNAFREITAAERGRAELIRDKIKKEYFLWVLAPKFQIPYIQAALKALDEPWIKDDVDGRSEVYYKAKFRDIANINEILTVPSSSGVAGSGKDNLVVVDSVNNGALFSGEPYRGQSYLKYAAQVDQPVPQVILEAAVYEVQLSDEKRLGLDYVAWKNGPGRSLFDFIGWGSSYNQRATNRSSIFDPFVPFRTPVSGSTILRGHGSGYYMAANYLVTAAYLDFLQGVGRAPGTHPRTEHDSACPGRRVGLHRRPETLRGRQADAEDADPGIHTGARVALRPRGIE